VNKCGFQIVDFYNEHGSDPQLHRNGCEADKPLMDDDDFFKFEKVGCPPLGLKMK